MPRRICPRCGSKKTAKILYGMPVMSPELEEQLNRGDVVLGGCCITDCDPVYHCNKCKKDFGAPTAELEAEATSFYFSIGGFFGENHIIMVLKMEDGAIVHYTAGSGYLPEEPTAKEQLSPEEWKALKIYGSNKYPVHWDKFIRTVNTLGFYIAG